MPKKPISCADRQDRGRIFVGVGCSRGLLKKSPRAPPKLPNKKDCYPWKEVRTTCFLFSCGGGEFSFAVCAVQILVCAPIARGLLRSLALRGVGERWGRSKNARHKAATHRASARPPHNGRVASRESAFAAPPPGGAHPRRVALVARRNARNNLGVSLLVTFLFAPAVSKRKVAMGAEPQDGYCLWAEVTLGSLREGAVERMRD